MKILKTMEEFNVNNIFTGDEIYIRNLKIKINFFHGYVKITDLENAEKTGKEVRIFKMDGDNFLFNNCIRFKNILSCDDLINILKVNNEISSTKIKAIKVFTPFKDLTDQKTINKIIGKDKVNKSDIIKLLRAENAEVTCIEKLTDDYKYDNANNFFKNEKVEVNRILEKIVERNHFTFFKENINEYTLFCNFESYKLSLK